MVFYRKYRPQTIAELDSEEIRQKLYSSFSDLSSIPHAFLFTGPKGLGKTSTARIIAKVVNCEKKSKVKSQKSKVQVKSQKLENEETKDQSLKTNDQIEPCNECQQCISITNGNNLDILEIDGASNRGIDEIRDLREKVKLSSVSANKKVYIIDEVHMLTTEAFNALLKTLEEPPGHVIFILCTTEPHKVPDTIISRCSHIPFKLATEQELLSSFKRISDQENLNIEEDVLSHIAALSDGSFRDGAKILDELVSLSKSSNQQITKELIEEKYKVSSIKYQVSCMMTLLQNRDTQGSIKLISELIETGVDMKYFIEKLVGELHTLLLMKVGVDNNSEFKVQNSELKIDEIKNLIELFTKAVGELKYAVLPQLPLEMAVIEWGMLTQNNSQDHAELPGSSVSRSVSSSGKDTDIWSRLIENVKVQNHSLAGILRGCSLKSFDKKTLEIETAYKFHKERLDDKKAMEILEKVVTGILGNKVKIGVVLKEK